MIITESSLTADDFDRLNKELARRRAESVKKRYDALPDGIKGRVDWMLIVGGVSEENRSNLEHLAVAAWEHHDGPFL